VQLHPAYPVPPIEKEAEGQRMTLKGRVGDGPAIRITANRGSVSVRKEGMPAADIPEPPAKPLKPMLPPKPPAEVKM
jgi:hypothetical protein